MGKPEPMTFERRIPASIEAVWSVISDPLAMVRTLRSSRIVSTTGIPGEVGSRYRVSMLGVTLERVVAETVPGRRLVLQSVSPSNGRMLVEWRGELKRDDTETILTWIVRESPLPFNLHVVSAVFARFEIPRWLAKVEREAVSLDR